MSSTNGKQSDIPSTNHTDILSKGTVCTPLSLYICSLLVNFCVFPLPNCKPLHLSVLKILPSERSIIDPYYSMYCRKEKQTMAEEFLVWAM